MDTHYDKNESHENAQAQQTALILESMPDAYLSVNQDWHCVYLNQAMEQLMHMRREDVLGRDVRELFADKAVARYRSFYEPAMNQRDLAALVGGTLTVESSPNRGTTVFVRVPLSQHTEGIL